MKATTSVETVFSKALKECQSMGIKYDILPNTTLNEALEILAGELPPSDKYPQRRFYCIGNGGKPTIFNNYKQSNHTAVEGNLFSIIPFVVRPKNNDLSISDRMKYRLRKEITKDGNEYVEYYMKVIDDNESPNYVRIISNGDDKIETSFEFDYNKTLAPVPTDVAVEPGKSNEYVAMSIAHEIVLTVAEIEDIKNAIKFKYGTDSALNITELALCTGYDELKSDTTYESIATQIAYNIPIDYDVQSMLNTDVPIRKKIELGVIEPSAI